MVLYRCSSGGNNVKTGTWNSTTSGEQVSIDTGLGNNLTHFFMHGPSAAYGNGMQEFVRWENTFGTNYYSGGGYSSGGQFAYTGFSETAANQRPVIVSINNGVVTVKAATANANYYKVNFTWYAW